MLPSSCHNSVAQQSESAEDSEASQGRSQSAPPTDARDPSQGPEIHLHPPNENDTMISTPRHSGWPGNTFSPRHPVHTNRMTPLPPEPITRSRSSSGLVLPPIYRPQPIVHYDHPAGLNPPPPYPVPPQLEAPAWYVSGWENRIISIGTPSPLDASFQHDHQGPSSFGITESAMLAPSSSISMSSAPSPQPYPESQPSSPASSETSSNGPSSRGDGVDWPTNRRDRSFRSQTPSSNPNNRHACHTCGTSFPRPSALRIHMHTHTGARPFRCPDPDCDATFTVNSNARRHYRLHGGDPTQVNNRRFYTNPTMPVTFHEMQVLDNEHLASSSGVVRWATPPIRPTRPQARRRRHTRPTPRKTDK